MKLPEIVERMVVPAQMLFVNTFAPRSCVRCFGLIRNQYLCQPCCAATEITLAATCVSCDRRRPHDLTGLTPCCEPAPATLWSLGPYEQPALAELIAKGKFTGAYDCFNWLGQLLGQELRAVASLFVDATLVPIPMTVQDERRRGFNQSAVIATALSQTIGLPATACLTKIRETKPQRTLDRDQRPANVYGAFTASGTVPKFAILVDDVKTTGATLREAGRVLCQAGAKTVLAITIAR